MMKKDQLFGKTQNLDSQNSGKILMAKDFFKQETKLKSAIDTTDGSTLQEVFTETPEMIRDKAKFRSAETKPTS